MFRFLPLLSLLMMLLAPMVIHAQRESIAITGNLPYDLRRASAASNDSAGVSPLPIINAESGEKSLWLAGGLSVIVPGAGQVYAQAPWWRTALYGAAEVFGWTVYAVYNNRGNEATQQFQDYADAHWDVNRYVAWIAANYQRWSDDQVNKQAAGEALASIHRSVDPSLPGWEQIDFTQLNKLEKAVHGGFSHTLPEHGDQQYYEEIGKYAQFRSGWDDHQFAADTLLYDPRFTTQNNLAYVADREQANRYLNYAQWAIGGLILNHVASMIDAVFAARDYNMKLKAELHGQLMPDGTMRPVGMVEMRVGF